MGGEIWALCESKNGRVPERSLEVVGAALYLAGLKRGAKVLGGGVFRRGSGAQVRNGPGLCAAWGHGRG